MLGKKKLFLFDIDGTVCLGDKLIPGLNLFYKTSSKVVVNLFLLPITPQKALLIM